MSGPMVILPGPVRPLHGAVASRAIERRALEAHPPHALMARAGGAVARLALALWPGARRVHAVAGPGNNGGDAIVAATWLHRQGLGVQLVLLGDPTRLPADARWALAQAQADGLHMSGELPASFDGDLIIDGLLGLGSSGSGAETDLPERRVVASPRPLGGVLARAVVQMNEARRPILAIDLPSGLDPDRGTCAGPAVRATHTLSLLTLKPGLFTAQGRDHAGRIWLDDLGVAASDDASRLHLIGRSPTTPAPHVSHKGRHGDVAVVGGAAGMSGAAVLAARAALASGAGRVFLHALDDAPAAFDPVRPELMLRPWSALAEPAWLGQATVVAGCGGGEAIRAALPVLLAHAARLVLDADALNAVAAEPSLQASLTARHRRARHTVLTPHPLEAARLLACTTGEVQADRIAAAGALSARFGCVAVLKGSGTVVARPDGRVGINPTGNARLSSAGTGDVLAGWTAGCWSRLAGSTQAAGVAGAAADSAWIDAARAAESSVYLHGLAAEHPGPAGPLLASDLITAMQADPG